MSQDIFIPKRINVGFQNRNDTYTGKLGYVIYYDQNGKLRKDVSCSRRYTAGGYPPDLLYRFSSDCNT